ncbi:hypothetical protein F7725_001430 [Dissostichus mawsoni]|uniref:Uncharacterized protein n=1 Tax=Dissostichus mawsoni TaxID=36200 RepID=A0A7J5ZHB6_DISMA|nr:hypothetical protein F7725_001430 [Dissostichus mawsoni]
MSPCYSGLSCESCSSGFERVLEVSIWEQLPAQHRGSQCDKCRSGYFGDPSRGRPDDCKPCPCPFSDSCFLDVDKQPTCDACRPGYTGRRCEKCAAGFQGNPLLPNGKCVPVQGSKCDSRGSISSSSSPCSCKNNVAGTLCDECKAGFFHLSDRAEGCLRCFCMGVTKSCSSSTWSRDQQFSLSNSRNSDTITEGISQRGSEVSYRAFSSLPNDVYYWLLPPSFRGDKVTAYGGSLSYTLRFEPLQRSLAIDGQPDVVLQGSGIFLEHFSKTRPQPRTPSSVSVTFRESSWRRADGQPCTREHLLMALADVSVFMIRASYSDLMAESSISDIKMDVAVPHSTGNERALEVEECSCPQGYTGPSCQQCLHNTAGPRCERCQTGFYGNPVTGGAQADGQPTCDNCPPGYTGRNCEREEKPPADSCDDPFLEKQIEGLLPVGCGAEAVFNFSWEKQIFPYGSGDDDETAGTTILPSQTLFSAAIHHRTTRETKSTGVGNVSVATPTDYPPGSPLASPPVRKSDTPACSSF